MATRTPLADLTNGHVVTDDELNSLPRGEIGYAVATSNQGSITTVADLTSLTLTLTLATGRRYRTILELHAFSTVAGDFYTLTIADSSNTVLNISQGPFATASGQQPVRVSYEENGAGSSVTRKARLARATGTGTLSTFATATAIARITVEDIGPAFT